jgi:hypothetical protein
MAQAEVLSDEPTVVSLPETPIVLLTPFYPDPEPARRDELVECLRRNAANELIAEIHVFLENGAAPELDDAKIRLVGHGRRATYSDLFDYANTELRGRRVVVANADIYFGRDLARLGECDLTGRLLCLSRWEVLPDGTSWLFDHPASQDAWIFDAPIRPLACDFHLGLPGCDNRLAFEAEQAGLILSNPARSLRAYHLHLSQVRNYDESRRVWGPTAAVPSGYLGPALDVRCAEVAFTETMGYRVARLEEGVSSHVNADRPFGTLPEKLRGLEFTQVVAHAAAPIEVEFLTSGKLFVLVGNDWHGYDHARAWLGYAGYDEQMPVVQNGPESGFEVWSLLGSRGDRLVLPTQVLLAAEHLVASGDL